MSLPIQEQFISLLERSKRPLLVLPMHANVDDFATAFVLAGLFAKMNKPVDTVTSGGQTPTSLSFLKIAQPVHGDLERLRKLVIRLKANQTKVDELSYAMEGDELLIHLTPKTGSWKPEDVTLETDSYRYDLIITLGASNLESIGPLFEQYRDFFFATPIANIDHATANEYFGQINLVDIRAASVSEVCFHALKQIDASLIDEEMATAILSGLIFKTNSFRSPSVTPYTLKTAGELMALGARRDEIVDSLYKTRSVETLRLWGRALARLKSEPTVGCVWTILTRADFAHAGTDESALESVIDELMMTSPEARVGIIFYEQEHGGVNVILHANRPYDALALGSPFNASGTRQSVHLNVKETNIQQAEKRVIDHVKQTLKELA